MKLAIKEVREKSGLTLKDLSERTGISIDFLSALEEEKMETCNSKTLSRLAEAMSVSVSDFFIEQNV